MLQSTQPETYQKQIRQQLEDIKHNLKFLQKVSTDLASLTARKRDPEKQVLLEKGDSLRLELKQKLKAMELNVSEIVAMLDWKVGMVVKRLAKIQAKLKNQPKENLQFSTKGSAPSMKPQLSNQKLIAQLEEQIFEFQKRQNQHVKEISQLKQKNAKLREQFSNLSFDSNQRIKELSQKLHNNTSPNLGIKKVQRTGSGNHNMVGKFQTSYFVTSEEAERKNITMGSSNNNFIKIKGNQQNYNGINSNGVSPQMGMNVNNNLKIKTKNNLLDSFASQSSEFDIKPYGDEAVDYDQNTSGNKLMLGCFPAKQVSQNTKTGSSSQNKRLKYEQNNEKSRRFQFLLNNLIDESSQKGDTSQQNGYPINERLGQSRNIGNGRFTGGNMGQKSVLKVNQLQTGNSSGRDVNKVYQYGNMRSPLFSTEAQGVNNMRSMGSGSKNIFGQTNVKRYQI